MNILTKEVQIDKIFDNIYKILPRDVLISCSQWAEENRFMNSKITGRSGKFSFKNAPYCREIVDCFSKNNNIQEIAIMKGVQLGLTTSVIENVIGYSINLDPCPMMFVFPNEKEAEKYKKLKINNLIDNSHLRSKITAETEDRNTRRTGDTALMIEFQGGFLTFASARKGVQLRSTPIKKLFLDELDAYPDKIKDEGNPIDIASKRTDSYIKFGRKICYNSTPLLAHKSKIHEQYKKGDCRKFFVPCPCCGQKQELIFYKSDGGEYSDEKAIIKGQTKSKPYGLLFDVNACKNGDYSSVRYRCKHCGGEFKDYHKYAIEQDGEWIPTQKSIIPYFRSYHISALYSLTKPWENIVLEFINAGNNPDKLQSFYNLNLGLPFEDRTGGLEYQKVHRLKDEDMENNILPKEALFLTCAADVQRDRIECEIKAWGDRYRCWGIDHRIFKGNVYDIYDPCWNSFLKIKDEVFKYADKIKQNGMQVELMAVDSGDGELRDVVYNFCDTFGDGLIMPLKGFVSTTRTREKFKIVPINEFETISLIEIYTDLYKNSLSRYLSQEERIDDDYPDGWFTFAKGYSDEYFRQLTTEQKVKVQTPGGLTAIKWVQHGRNEAFDLNVYNMALADIVIYQQSVLYLGLDSSNARAVFELMKKRK